jgi:hypothetical protein
MTERKHTRKPRQLWEYDKMADALWRIAKTRTKEAPWIVCAYCSAPERALQIVHYAWCPTIIARRALNQDVSDAAGVSLEVVP